MKKLFVSVPMKGRTEENIKKSIDAMHKMAEIAFGEELGLINSFIESTPPKDNNVAVFCLGESIKKLAQADYFVGIHNAYEYNGCMIENEVAARYYIQALHLNIHDCKFMEDVEPKMGVAGENCAPCC